MCDRTPHLLGAGKYACAGISRPPVPDPSFPVSQPLISSFISGLIVVFAWVRT
jgi:hypothetical protein